MSEFLEKIKIEVFKRRPVLSDLVRRYGNLSLFDYIKNNWQISQQSPDKIFLSCLGQELEILHGKDVAEKVLLQLELKPLISTISHMGIWGHPIFVNAELIYSLHFSADEFAVCLATESVSLNNTSSLSGSVLRHEGQNLKRTSFFTDKQKTLPVFSTPAIGDKETEAFKNKAGEQGLNLLEILNFKKADNFSLQCCQSSANLWSAVFPSAPKLLYLPLETIVLKYLLKILTDDENIFFKLILTSNGQALWKKYFTNEHTFMFWVIDEKRRREALTELPDNNKLISLIQKQKVYPSGPLCFAVLLYAGFACAGGFNQTTWLTQTKEKFLLLLEEMDEPAVIKKITPVPTQNFAESSLAYLNIGGNYVTPTAWDLLSTQKDFYQSYKELSQKLTLRQTLDLAMPEIYSVVVPKHEQISSFELEQAKQEIIKTALTEIKALL